LGKVELIRLPDGTGVIVMLELNSAAVLWAFGAVHFMGWTCGVLARCGHRSRHRAVCHAIFLPTLVIVGIATSFSLFLGTKCWLLSATTLAGMILLAICDFDRARRPATI
jgi:hypothetical protein